MDEAAKHEKHTCTNTDEQVVKASFGERVKFRRNAHPLPKAKTAKKRTSHAVSRPCVFFFRIPHAFLILLAGFSPNLAAFSPVSGHFYLVECFCARFHVAKVLLVSSTCGSVYHVTHIVYHISYIAHRV